MSFAKTLSRLKKASSGRPHGVNVNETFVLINDLRDMIRDWERLDTKVREPGQTQTWIACSELMPEPEVEVLIVVNGVRRIGALFWEYPGHEDTYQAFTYWDDPEEDGHVWEHADVTHWAPLLAIPENGDS